MLTCYRLGILTIWPAQENCYANHRSPVILMMNTKCDESFQWSTMFIVVSSWKVHLSLESILLRCARSFPLVNNRIVHAISMDFEMAYWQRRQFFPVIFVIFFFSFSFSSSFSWIEYSILIHNFQILHFFPSPLFFRSLFTFQIHFSPFRYFNFGCFLWNRIEPIVIKVMLWLRFVSGELLQKFRVIFKSISYAHRSKSIQRVLSRSDWFYSKMTRNKWRYISVGRFDPK